MVWAPYRLRRSRGLDGPRHRNLLDGSTPLHSRSPERQAVSEGNLQPERPQDHGHALNSLSLRGDVLGSLRPDRLPLDLPSPRDGPHLPRGGVVGIADSGRQSNPHPHLHPALHLRPLPEDLQGDQTHSAAENRRRALPHGWRLRTEFHHPELDRCRAAPQHCLAGPRLCSPDRCRDSRLHCGPRIRLHPGAPHHEIDDHGALSPRGFTWQHLYRRGQSLHPDPFPGRLRAGKAPGRSRGRAQGHRN